MKKYESNRKELENVINEKRNAINEKENLKIEYNNISENVFIIIYYIFPLDCSSYKYS